VKSNSSSVLRVASVYRVWQKNSCMCEFSYLLVVLDDVMGGR